MAGPAHVSEPTVLYLYQLMDELTKGYLQIPRFQRRFVWDDDQRLELLQSIRDGIPIGSILVWRTSLTALKTVTSVGPHSLPEPVPSATSPRNYLLDGLQRLSTLYGCLRPLPTDRSAFVRDEDGKEVSWLVGYDLDAEQFQILRRDETPSLPWLPLTRLLDSVRLLQFQRGLANLSNADQLIQRADALAETFRSYKLPVVPVVTEDLASATRTFERVNRQGTPMSELHMVRALTWNADFDLEERFSTVREQLAAVGWESLEPEWILKVCKAALGVDIAVEEPDESSKRLADRPSAIDDATRSLNLAARWLRQTCGVFSPRIVPYRMQIVMLADAFRICPKPDQETSRRLAQWFWLTTYAERFSGITGGQTSTMLEHVRSIARGNPSELKGKDPRMAPLTLPHNFNATWVRVKTIALMLASQGPKELDGSPIGASEQLATQGPNALLPFAPGQRGCASRVFIGPPSERGASDLRQQLLVRASDIGEDILRSHAITPEAADALNWGQFARFADLRGAEILRLEYGFLNSLLRAPGDDDMPF